MAEALAPRLGKPRRERAAEVKETYQFIAVLVNGNGYEVLQRSFFASAEKAEKEFKRLHKRAWADYDVYSLEVKPDEF